MSGVAIIIGAIAIAVCAVVMVKDARKDFRELSERKKGRKK